MKMEWKWQHAFWASVKHQVVVLQNASFSWKLSSDHNPILSLNVILWNMHDHYINQSIKVSICCGYSSLHPLSNANPICSLKEVSTGGSFPKWPHLKIYQLTPAMGFVGDPPASSNHGYPLQRQHGEQGQHLASRTHAHIARVGVDGLIIINEEHTPRGVASLTRYRLCS